MFTSPSQAKLPYSPWKRWMNSPFANKIRAALGMRQDDNGVNTTHRQDFTGPGGTAVSDDMKVCHHFEQDSATADAVKISVQQGQALVIVIPPGTRTADIIQIQNPDGMVVSRLQADGTTWS